MFVRTKVPAAENGFRFVSQFAAKEGSEAVTTIQGEVDEKVWDLQLALEILEKEKSRLEAFDKCVESPQFQVPEVRSFSEPLRYITNCREVGDLAFLRAWAFFKQGREKEATDAALALVRFGQEMEGSQGHLEHYYRGTHMKDLGLRRLREMLPGLNLGPDQHLIMIEELRKYRP